MPSALIGLYGPVMRSGFATTLAIAIGRNPPTMTASSTHSGRALPHAQIRCALSTPVCTP